MTPGELMQEGLDALEIPADKNTINNLLGYLRELRKWSKQFNLVGKASDRDIIESHFLDSLTVLPYLDPCPPPGLVDVGSGAGFPGLPLKILRPDIPATLVEPRGKRASFLRHIIRTLKLSDIKVIEQRLEENSHELKVLHNRTPLLISRAVTTISPFLEMCRPYCVNGGRVICMKGPKLEQELAEWIKAGGEDDGFSLSSQHTTALPFSGISRNLIIFSYHNR